ncbi:MAG: 2-C-methyl-D-erythritol 2,4-cyclodiphosphate synthase [Deltaproteobacteria bacterium]|nr:2-C-methyl-D-erythritol 2,4-cyclodiphosphate synthase [Deltaproteobacteria bacterium]
MENTNIRIGIGYDVHKFAEQKPLILGGIKIPYSKGLLGHSDADVLTHAIIDAILGGLAQGDIGRHFPDTDPAYKGIESIVLLDKVMSLAKSKGYKINNLDATIVAQKPKLATYLKDMEKRISDTLKTNLENVNIKATTTEGLGFCGRGEGIAAYAAVTLIRT